MVDILKWRASFLNIAEGWKKQILWIVQKNQLKTSAFLRKFLVLKYCSRLRNWKIQVWKMFYSELPLTVVLDFMGT